MGYIDNNGAKLDGVGNQYVVLSNAAGTILTELPATSALQTTGNSSLASILSGMATATLQSTGNSSLASILSGMATATLQTAGNASLSGIDGKLGSLGQKTMAGSAPMVIASDQTNLPAVIKGGTDGVPIDNLNTGTGLNAFNIALTGTNYLLSTANSTTGQLAVGATYTGTIETIFNQQAISLLLTSDQNGTFTLNQYIDLAGTRKTSVLSFTIIAGVPFSRCIQANGNYFNLTFKNTGSATTTTLNINTAYGTLPSTTALANGPVSIDEINGIAATARPDGFLRVVADPTTLLFDPFDSYDTTNTWTAGGTVPPTGGGGNLTIAPGTTASAASYTKSQPSFMNGSNAFLQYASIVATNAAGITGNQRFWGIGSYVTPTLSAPVTDGSIFELDNVTGNLLASVYQNSARTNTATLVRPTDGGLHRYAVYQRASRVYFELDSVVVATFAFPNPTTGSLSIVMGSINGGSTVSAAPILSVSVSGIGDTAKSSHKISDGKFPWRTTTVDGTGNLYTSVQAQVTQSDKSGSGTITALNGVVVATTNGTSTVVFGITGTWAATLFFKGVRQDGTYEYLYANFIQFGTDTNSQSTTINGTYVVNSAGFSNVEVMAGLFTSGTVSVAWIAASGLNLVKVYQPTAKSLQATAWANDGVGNSISSSNVPGTASKQGYDFVQLSPVTNYYSAAVNIRQTATTVAGSTVWSMRNAAAATKTIILERIYLMMSFDSATPIGRTLLRYDLVRFTGATPTGGTAIVVSQMESSNAATQVTDVRFLDTGLTTTGITFGAAFATISCPGTDQTTAVYFRETIGFKLAPGEGFAIRLSIAAAAGQGLAGEVIWSEK